MVGVEEAVKTASSLIMKVMPEYAALHPKVEEFILSKDGSSWNITFRAENPNPDKRYAYLPYKDKLVQIKASDGELIAIRNPSYE